MKYLELLLNFLTQSEYSYFHFIGIPRRQVINSLSYEYFQHAHMIVKLYHLQHAGMIDTN